jgi:4-hydroxy-3-methylbut-2-enyl diphosphate reductase
MFRAAMAARYPDDPIEDRFRSFDTICTATQERQDAVIEMMADPPDVMIVIGGFNSSNTGHLREIAVERCPTFHIEGPEGLISAGRIRHKPEAGSAETIESENWLPERRPIAIGVTAGASTPNRVVGEAIERLVELSGSAMV